jgi:molecular chaperone GrpE
MTGKRTTEQEPTNDMGQEPDQPQAPNGEAAETEEPARDLAAELEETNDRYLRLAADFENFKKRARQERVELIQYASAQLAERLLPVLDDFERVVEHTPDGLDENWSKGIRMTMAKLEEVLESVGVEPIEAAGSHFDPKLHEAIATEESADHPEDTVLSELRRGYRMHDRVLRPALVRISRRPAEAAAPEPEGKGGEPPDAAETPGREESSPGPEQ